MRGSVAAEVTSLVTREHVHEQVYATRVPEGPTEASTWSYRYGFIALTIGI